MLRIHTEQMTQFRGTARTAFEEEMRAHLARFSPPLYRATGEAGMLATIRLGMRDAADHGLTLRGPLRLYLELMLLFGSHFPSDPQHPQLRAILVDRDGGSQMQRADRLFAATMAYRRSVGGPNDEHTLRALRTIHSEAQDPGRFTEPRDAAAILADLARIHPEKAAHLGEAPLLALVDAALAHARRLPGSTPRGETLLVVMMLAFGHGCADDPLYPWIGATLTRAVAEGAPWPRRLERKAMTWLRHVLAHFDGGPRA